MTHILRRRSAGAMLGLLVLAAAFLMPAPSFAFEVRTGTGETPQEDVLLIPEGEVVNDDLFLFGTAVQIDGTVNGDVYVFAQEVRMAGTIQGDLVATASRVDISGTVEDDVLAGVGDLTLSGTIGDNVLLAAGTAQLQEESRVGRDVLAGVGQLSSLGSVERFLSLGAGSVEVNGTVGESIRGSVDRLTLNDSAVVEGNVAITGERAPQVAEEATVQGEVNFTSSLAARGGASADDQPSVLERSAWAVGAWLLKFLSVLLLSVLVVLFLPSVVNAAEATIRERSGRSALAGVLALLTFPLVSLFFLLSGVGVLVALAWLASLALLVLCSTAAVGLWLGRVVLAKLAPKTEVHELWAVSLGVLCLSVLFAIPLVGGVFQFLTICTGVGAILLAIRSRNRQDQMKGAPGA